MRQRLKETSLNSKGGLVQMKNEDMILSAVRENSKQLTSLNREVGEIKATLSSKSKHKAKNFAVYGMFTSTGVLLSRLIEIIF